jgi:glucose-1-phosphate adenylyltransferase
MVADGTQYSLPIPWLLDGCWNCIILLESPHGSLEDKPPFDLNDSSWIIHTRTEERPPVWIARSATIENSMICDGCEIAPDAKVIRSVLSPGVLVKQGAVVRESIILTDSVIESDATVERSIIDKKVHIQSNAKVGGMGTDGEPILTMVGKNSIVPQGFTVEPGAVIGTDVADSDYPAKVFAEMIIFSQKG